MIRDASEIKRLLADTFADFRLSKGENGALRSVLREANADDLALWRHHGFRQAQEFIKTGYSAEVVLIWLEDINKLLVPQTKKPATTRACFSPREDCAATITGLIDRTLKSMDLCVFTITDDRLTAAILAAHNRGVRIRIMTDNEKSYDEGSDIGRMALAGVSVFIDNSPYHMHHKFGIFDGAVVLTGSYNWTRSASLNNEENLVILEDPHLTLRFQDEFDSLLNQESSAPFQR